MTKRYSRWVELAALKKMTAEEVVGYLRSQWSPRMGALRVLLSDDGRQLTVEVPLRYCTAVGIRNMCGTTYYSQGDSVAESSRGR